MSSWRAIKVTEAPSSNKERAQALPIPPEPPVMKREKPVFFDAYTNTPSKMMLWLDRSLGAFQTRIQQRERATGKKVIVGLQNISAFRDADAMHTLRMAQAFHKALPHAQEK